MFVDVHDYSEAEVVQSENEKEQQQDSQVDPAQYAVAAPGSNGGADFDDLAEAACTRTNTLQLSPREENRNLKEDCGNGIDHDEGGLTKHPLMVAWKLGRLVQASRELKLMEDAGRAEDANRFPREVLEQIRRIGLKFEESQNLLNAKITDLPIHETNPKMKLEWGLQIAHGLVRAIYSVERDLDVCKSISALQEKDLDEGLKESVVRVDALGVHKPFDSTWRVITHNKAVGAKGDDIIVESMADALDEPIGSIWLSGYSPPPVDNNMQGGDHTTAIDNSKHSSAYAAKLRHGSTCNSLFEKMPRDPIPKGDQSVAVSHSPANSRKTPTEDGMSRDGSPPSRKVSFKSVFRKTKKFLSRKFTSKFCMNHEQGEIWNGITLPHPEKGHSRSTSVFFACKVTPIHPPGKARLRGFRQTSIVEARIPPAALAVISVMPNFMVRKMARGYLENAVKVFAEKVSLPDIERRLSESPRAPFYKQLHLHLLGEPPAPLDWSDETFLDNLAISNGDAGPGKSVVPPQTGDMSYALSSVSGTASVGRIVNSQVSHNSENSSSRISRTSI